MKKFNIKLRPADQDRMIIDAMRRMHENWIRYHEDEFFTPGNEYTRHLFMPFELIGWEAARKYLYQLDLQELPFNATSSKQAKFPAIRRTYQIVVDEESIRAAYLREQERFRKECSITSVHSFYRLFQELRRHGYEVSSAICSALQTNEDLVFQVAAQVLRHNKGIFCATPRE